MSEEPAIQARHLAFAYGDTPVLHDLTLDIPWGRITGYLGPNGAGKSTTIKLLVGLMRPDAGEIRIGGLDPVEEPEARQLIGYVPEGGGLYQLLTPREHLSLVAELHTLEPSKAAARIEDFTERFELSSFVDRRIDTLSKGQRQRVAIATGLLHDPRVILVDEPLSGLDAAAARAFRDLLRQRAAQGAAVLYCSHVLDVVERICDHTIVLAQGRIVADAPTQELVSKGKRTLESVFLELTRTSALGAALDESKKTTKKGKR